MEIRKLLAYRFVKKDTRNSPKNKKDKIKLRLIVRWNIIVGQSKKKVKFENRLEKQN